MGAKYIQSDYNDAASTIQTINSITSTLNAAKTTITAYNGNLKAYSEGPVVELFSSRLDIYLNIINTMMSKIEELANACNSYNNKVASAISPKSEISQEMIDLLTEKINNLENKIASLKNSLYTTDSETGETKINPSVASQIKNYEQEITEFEKEKKELVEKLEEESSLDNAGGSMISSLQAAISKINITL